MEHILRRNKWSSGRRDDNLFSTFLATIIFTLGFYVKRRHRKYWLNILDEKRIPLFTYSNLFLRNERCLSHKNVNLISKLYNSILANTCIFRYCLVHQIFHLPKGNVFLLIVFGSFYLKIYVFKCIHSYCIFNDFSI